MTFIKTPRLALYIYTAAAALIVACSLAFGQTPALEFPKEPQAITSIFCDEPEQAETVLFVASKEAKRDQQAIDYAVNEVNKAAKKVDPKRYAEADACVLATVAALVGPPVGKPQLDHGEWVYVHKGFVVAFQGPDGQWIEMDPVVQYFLVNTGKSNKPERGASNG